MATERKKAMLFDLDDTIITWDAISDECWLTICRRFQPRFDGVDAEKVFITIKTNREWFLSDRERHRWGRLNLPLYRREIASKSLKSLGMDDQSLANEIADAYGVEREARSSLVPGAMETIKYFRESGYRLVMITNGSGLVQRRKIERFKLAPFFDCILVEGEMGIGKPEERVFRQALEKVGVPAAEACMVGDDLERDIGGAKNLGISGVWVDWRGVGLSGSVPVKPDRVIRSIAELLDHK